MSQTTYLRDQPAGRPGMLADNSWLKDSVSAVNDEASAEIQFGIMVQQAAEGKCTILTAATNKFLGISLLDHAYHLSQELGDTGVKPDMMLDVLRRGRIFVKIDEDVAVGDAVRFRIDNGGGGVPGVFRKTADAGNTTNVTFGARWVKGGTSALGFAVLEIDLLALEHTAD